jgi:hypothetical protein
MSNISQRLSGIQILSGFKNLKELINNINLDLFYISYLSKGILKY